MHRVSEPAILYFGTPVVLVSTLNADGSPNLAPISSVFWLGWRCMIGVAASSKTSENLARERECVLNLPSSDMTDAVNRLALTTGSNPVPDTKLSRGYRHRERRPRYSRKNRTAVGTVRIRSRSLASADHELPEILRSRAAAHALDPRASSGRNVPNARHRAGPLRDSPRSARRSVAPRLALRFIPPPPWAGGRARLRAPSDRSPDPQACRRNSRCRPAYRNGRGPRG